MLIDSICLPSALDSYWILAEDTRTRRNVLGADLIDSNPVGAAETDPPDRCFDIIDAIAIPAPSMEISHIENVELPRPNISRSEFPSIPIGFDNSIIFHI